MPRRAHGLVLRDCTCGLSASCRLSMAAHQWCSPAWGPKKPKFSIKHRDMLVELAFLKAFLAWENLLEESFLLYLIGKASPRRYLPRRIATPSTRKSAIALTAEGRKFADWDNPDLVRQRASRFFKNGAPYEKALSRRINLLQNMQVVRNALVHQSDYSRVQFQRVVRERLGSFPSDMTVGKFLNTTVPSSNPPTSFFDLYINCISAAAEQIIP